MLTWHRMLLINSVWGDELVELATEGAVLFERTGTRVKQKTLKTPDAAQRTAFELATKCLDLASTSFNVHFARAESWVVDQEHGGPSRPFGLGRNYLADFYRSPARIAAIAREKLRGKLRRDDGFAEPDPSWDWGGDEVLVRLGRKR